MWEVFRRLDLVVSQDREDSFVPSQVDIGRPCLGSFRETGPVMQ